MKTLKDVYIKVTENNQDELKKLIHIKNITVGSYLIFSVDHLFSFDFENEFGLEDRKKVSLAELKRLIDTIPTREEITRLKQQVSAYKMNLSLVNERCKELQSDNERLNNINLTLKQTNNVLYDNEDSLFYKISNLEKKLDIQADLIRDKNAQLEQLKQRKWWQIW